ncbi:MAG: lipopolysaccharide transport system permease protein [Solirubrobacteraceae bacterium]|nr:lipopolysaccharide transport system permease protein [Solirubrobacteraceae bacterium]
MAHRYLFEQMVRRELRQKYKGSALGVLWYLINPLVLMGAYYFMFGIVFKVAGPDQPEQYPLFLLVGLVVWIFFSQSLLSAAPSLLDHGALVRKARFPRETIPASVVTVQLVTFVVLLALLGPVTIAIRGTLDPALLVLPLVLVCLFAFVLGLALAVSVLHAYFRDVAPILSAALLPWFFMSPIFFEPEAVTHQATARFVLEWVNPVAPFIGAVRDCVYGGVVPDARQLAYVLIASAVALLGGLALFRRMQGELAVVV